MPFGAAVYADGSVLFRLWAPAAPAVVLRLEDDEQIRRLPMRPQGDGWHRLRTRLARPGSRYRFELAGLAVPDPASRFNPDDVHGPSQVVDPRAFEWRDVGWRGRPWAEAVLYELHVGTFSPEGTFAGVTQRLDYLRRLGVTAIELMPVADFAGRRNWGYDGVLPFAPESRYGRPEDLKILVQEAHRRRLMVLLDVVYNHFGPEGNFLGAYAPEFFDARHATPWGEGINFDGPGSRQVRDFFIHNALYWLEEFHLDGLRLDAVHAIRDSSRPDFLSELAAAVHRGPGRARKIHLVLENVINEARRLARDASGNPRQYTAQWNDDFHHAMHVLLTGERDGRFADFADDPLRHLGRCLAEGFAYQGEVSPYHGHRRRGEPSADLPPAAFINALQTHDQVGNRAYGERFHRLVPDEALRTALAVLLLAPSPPLLFMGEEFAAAQPFLFFCDFPPALAASVRAGRNEVFRRGGSPPADRPLPDPNDPGSCSASRLSWRDCERPPHGEWLEFYRHLLAIRRRQNARLAKVIAGATRWRRLGPAALAVAWRMEDGGTLHLVANLGEHPCAEAPLPKGRIIYRSRNLTAVRGSLPPWSVAWIAGAAG
jgi:malto-oligosyltrehalose trehalohydrolase